MILFPHLSRNGHFGLMVLALLTVIAPVAAPAGAAGRHPELAARIADDFPSLEKLYRHLHTHPELSFREAQTAAKVAAELKALGAHNLNPGRPGGLTGRARILALIDAYERFRQPPGLPATYQVVYGVLRKPL